jgi:peptidoglycan/xylan/chitin deacetylase (PgdA/CDA1 family)
MFHHFCDENHPRGQGAISAQEFASVLRHLGRKNILPAEEWARRANEGTLSDSDLCITFDDGLRCQFDVALPVLKSFGISAFWFVYSCVFEGTAELLEVYRYFRTTTYSSIDEFHADFFKKVTEIYNEEYKSAERGFDANSYLTEFPFYSKNDRLFRFLRDDILGNERYSSLMRELMEQKNFEYQDVLERLWMDDDHIRTLSAAGHVVGLHSYTHPTRLAGMPVDEQLGEYGRNLAHLTRVLGKRPTAMSHPCNSYTADTLSVLADLGISLGFRATMRGTAGASVLERPREDHANIMAEMLQ